MDLVYIDGVLSSFYSVVFSFFNSSYVSFLGVFCLIIMIIKYLMRWSH